MAVGQAAELVQQAGHLGEPIADGPGRHGHQHDVGIGGVAAVAAESGDGVSCLLPAAGQPAADVAPAEVVMFMVSSIIAQEGLPGPQRLARRAVIAATSSGASSRSAAATLLSR